MSKKDVVDWYFEYGRKRTGRFMITPGWLDKVMGIVEREENLAPWFDLNDGEKKSSLALWGESQSGKSTLISHYLDGKDPEGRDSALTWDDKSPVLFSGCATTPKTTVVFNPFNGGLDASGVATKFYRPADPGNMNRRYPAEISFCTRKQIMLTLAMGYYSECILTPKIFQEADFTDIAGKFPAADRIDRAAFTFLRELCDICEILAMEHDRFAIFQNDRHLRQCILSNSSLNGNLTNAENFAAIVLWDDGLWNNGESQHKITLLFKRLLDFKKNELSGFQGKKCRLTMRLAAEIENISNHSVGIDFSIHGNEVLFESSSAGNCRIPSENFYLFQALIGELRIPVKAVNDNRHNCPHRQFMDFLSAHDLIDFPGITRLANGGHAVTKIDLSASDTNDKKLLQTLYKTGKTLAIIYGQLENGQIDAFAILVNLSNCPLHRPALLSHGIQRWIYSLTRKGWDMKSKIPVDLFVNFSCFGSKIKDISGLPGGNLESVVKLASDLPFARCGIVDVFFTTSKYSEIVKTDPEVIAVKEICERDNTFKNAFLQHGTTGKISFEKLFTDKNDPFATDYFFEISGKISYHKRDALQRELREKDEETMRELVQQQLPAAGSVDSMAVLDKISKALADPNAGEDAKVEFIRRFVDVKPSLLDPLPENTNYAQPDYHAYIQKQIAIWHSSQLATENKKAFEKIFEPHQLAIANVLKILSAFDLSDVSSFVQQNFAFVGLDANIRQRARTPLALLLGNLLLTGQISRPVIKPNAKEHLLLTIFKARIDDLKKNLPTLADRPQQIGDNELSGITI